MVQNVDVFSGLLRLTDAYSPPDAHAVLGYEAYQYGPERASWSPGYIPSTMPDNVTRYISNGAAVSVPSENLGFYFSGIRGARWGPTTQSTRDWHLANTLIEVDMSTMRKEEWSNNSLPDDIEPRAGAELVWIPVGGQGALVAVGGMTAVEDRLPAGLNSSQLSDAEKESPSFMTSLPVYDIVSKTWYMQNTTGDGPGPLTEFCSVVARAKDASSFNVYLYGGYTGLNSTTIPSDDVWILSIPTFTWVKAYSGIPAHGRRGHKCERVYPDQMLVIGGVNPNPEHCIASGPIQVFNLNTLKFQDVYDPQEWSEYAVPDLVTAVIGGNSEGGSTKTTTFSDKALSSIFQTPYTKTMNKYYPYPAASGSPGASPVPTPVSSSSGLAKWVAPVLGVVLGLIVLSIAAVLVLVYRRRRNHGSSVSGSQGSGKGGYNRVLHWVNGMPPNHSDHKTDTSVTSTEAESDNCVSSPVGLSEVGGQQRYEVDGVEKVRPVPPVAELATEYNSRDNPQCSRNIDFAYGPGGSDNPSHSPQSTSQAQIHGLGLISSPSNAVSPQSPRSSQSTRLHSPRAGSGNNGSAPSPCGLPHSPEDVGSRSLTTSPSPTSSAAHSPDLQNRAAADAGGAGGLERRPTHERNVSSLSSNIYQLPSPELVLTPDDEGEEGRRGDYSGGLFGGRSLGISDAAKEADPERPVGSEEGMGSKDGTIPGGTTKGGLERKQTSPGKKSSFGEMLDEGDEARK